MKYAVNLWGSNPDDGNDDCWTGIDFDSLEEARAFYDNPTPEKFPTHCPSSDAAWLQLLSEPDDNGIGTQIDAKSNPNYDTKKAERERRYQERLERSEAQHQAAMEFGVQGWNDFEGC